MIFLRDVNDSRKNACQPMEYQEEKGSELKPLFTTHFD